MIGIWNITIYNLKMLIAHFKMEISTKSYDLWDFLDYPILSIHLMIGQQIHCIIKVR